MNVGDARPHHGGSIAETSETTNELGIENSAAVILPAGTVCLSRTGSIGYAVMLGRPMATSQGFVNWICGPELTPRFLQLIFLAEQPFLHEISEGVAHTTIYFPEAKAFHVLVPSVEQQLRLVSEIDEQFSRLDEANRSLQGARKRLVKYRLSALQEAFTDCDESWRWGTYADVGEVTTGSTPSTADPQNFGGATPFFKPSDLDAGSSVLLAREHLSKRGLAKARKLPAGSLLVTCIGATIGKTGLAQVDCATNQQINAVSPREDVMDPRFLYWWTVSPRGQRQIVEGASATTLPIINKSKFSALAVPVPTLQVQRRIVAEVDRRLSIVREVEAEVDANLKRAQALRQAVLQRAFSGRPAGEAKAGAARPVLKLIPGTMSLTETAQVALSAEIVHRLRSAASFGRVKHQKVFHLCEYIAQLDAVQGHYVRAAAGPLDLPMIEANERRMEALGWYAERQREAGGQHEYLTLSKAGEHTPYLACFTDDQLATIRKLIDLMRDWKTDRCEMVSTAYAAWNDLVLFGTEPTPEAIASEVLEKWDVKKRRFGRAEWLQQITWIKQQGFEPSGFGRSTRGRADGLTPDLFRSELC